MLTFSLVNCWENLAEFLVSDSFLVALSEGVDLLVEISLSHECLRICPWLMLFSSSPV